MKRYLPYAKRNLSASHLVLAAFLIANLIWAAASPVVILTVEFLPPIEFLFYRFLLTCALILPIVVWELKKSRANMRDLPALITLGLLGYGSLIFIFEGLRYTSAIDAAIIGIASPIIVAIAGAYFYKDKISFRYKFGILLAIIGTLFVVIEPALSSSTSQTPFSERIYGNIMVLIYSACVAFYMVLSKEIMGENSSRLNAALRRIKIKKNAHTISPFLQTALSFYIALGFYTVLFFVKMLKQPTEIVSVSDLAQMDKQAIYGLLYMALISGLLAYSLMNWGLKRATVSYSAVFTYLGPVLTLPFAYYMLDELPTVPAVVGSIIIGIGVIIAEYSPKTKD